MRRRNACVIALGLLLVTGHLVHAEEAEPVELGRLLPQKKWARFEVVSGRITALDIRCGQPRRASIGNPQEGLGESVCLRDATLRYELIDQAQHLTVEFSDGCRLQVRRVPRGEASLPRVSFSQCHTQPLRLVIGEGAEQRSIEAASLWHLLIAEPQACQQHLLPILERLRPHWRLAERAEQVERSLFRLVQSDGLAPREQLKELVQQLGAPSFRVRQAADRQLRQLGHSVLGYLERLDQRSLDAEQRLRTQRIRQALAVRQEDTADRVAAWLIDDTSIWLTLLAHQHSEKRRLAMQHLCRIHDRPIRFDPAANALEREAQIAELQSRLMRR